MSPIQFAALAFVCIIISSFCGALLRTRLPEHHVSGDSKDVIKLSIALVATMSALVLALLFASTRTSFERTSGLVSRLTADITELDRVLKHYGKEAEPVRTALRAEIQPMIDSIWRDEAIARGVRPDESKTPEEEVLFMLQDLQPANSKQRALHARAIQISSDLAQTQLALFAQPTDSISNTFLVVLILWLMFIFGIFSMTSAPNIVRRDGALHPLRIRGILPDPRTGAAVRRPDAALQRTAQERTQVARPATKALCRP